MAGELEQENPLGLGDVRDEDEDEGEVKGGDEVGEGDEVSEGGDEVGLGGDEVGEGHGDEDAGVQPGS